VQYDSSVYNLPYPCTNQDKTDLTSRDERAAAHTYVDLDRNRNVCLGGTIVISKCDEYDDVGMEIRMF